MSSMVNKIDESIYKFMERFGQEPSIIFLNKQDYSELFNEVNSYSSYKYSLLDNLTEKKFRGVPIRKADISFVGCILDLN